MTKLSFSRQFLRRKDARRRLKYSAVVECRGVSRKIEVVDFSTAGLRLDGVTGLATGDHVRILLTPRSVGRRNHRVVGLAQGRRKAFTPIGRER